MVAHGLVALVAAGEGEGGRGYHGKQAGADKLAIPSCILYRICYHVLTLTAEDYYRKKVTP